MHIAHARNVILVKRKACKRFYVIMLISVYTLCETRALLAWSKKIFSMIKRAGWLLILQPFDDNNNGYDDDVDEVTVFVARWIDGKKSIRYACDSDTNADAILWSIQIEVQ